LDWTEAPDRRAITVMQRQTYCYRFGSAEFDEARAELRVAGLPVELEPRVLDLLAYLLRHAGELVTKEELLREVWAGRVTVDKVLPNAVAKLRRALGAANAACLVTQARLGYRLDGPVSRRTVGREAGSTHALKAGDAVPGRGNFVLRRQLGHHRGSEVWLAEHTKTGERRVYKFAADGERLRALKREATLARVLQESLPPPRGVVGLIDWQFDSAPYFLESEYGGDSLLDWAAGHLAALGAGQRLALFLAIADAVAAAHAVGVLHKDLKPANVLVMAAGEGWRLCLTDFGSGRLLEPGRLEELGISRLGMTVEDAADGSSGTPLYIAPELFAGQAPTVRSDLFALGILLYQLLTGRLGQPMASGWEAEIADPLLREDLRAATDLDPARRPASVAEFAARLRALPQRHAEASAQAARAARAAADAAALARTQARRPFVLALILALAVGLGVVAALQRQANAARAAAEAALARANALSGFLNEDLVGGANPLVLAQGREAVLKDVLLAARERVALRFSAQPASEATVRASLAGLLNTLDLWDEAAEEARHGLARYAGTLGERSHEAIALRALLARVLSRSSRFDEARGELQTLERLVQHLDDPHAQALVAAAWSTFHITRGEFAEALPRLRRALAADAGIDTRQRDSLRIDLISALTFAGAAAAARAEGQALLAEASARGAEGELLGALARLAAARAEATLGDGASAEAMLLAAQPVIVARLGEAHSRHLSLLNELYALLHRRGDYPRALIYAEQVHTRVRSKLGDGHNMSWVTLVNWGRTLYESGDDAAAAQRLGMAHAALQRLLGDAAAQVQDAAVLLAASRLGSGDLDGAEALLAGIDPDGPHGARGEGLRGLLLQRRGRHAEALPPLQAAIAALAPDPAAPADRFSRTLLAAREAATAAR
jgi:eukaryotic-like serine/threonine-protein kinase